MRMEMSQSIEQKTELEQRVELRQALTITMNQIARDLFESNPVKPSQYFEGLVDVLANEIQSDSLRQGVVSLMKNPQLVQEMMKNAEDLIDLDPKVVKGVSVGAIYEMTQGQFSASIGEGEDKKQVKYETTKGRFVDAFFRPEEMKQELELVKDHRIDLLKSGGNTASQDAAIAEMESALQLAQTFGDLVSNMEQVITLFHSLKTKDGLGLSDFFKDLAITQKLQFIISERIMARFASRFSGLSKNERVENNSDAFLNSVFEFILVSNGVINEKIFSLHSAKLDEVESEVVEGTMDELDEIYRRYNLSKNTTIFWHRWAVIGKKQTAKTDNQIRDLMRLFREEDGPELLSLVEFEAMFKEVQSINSEVREGELEKEIGRDQLSQLLVSALGNEKVKEHVIKLMHDKWYDRFVAM